MWREARVHTHRSRRDRGAPNSIHVGLHTDHTARGWSVHTAEVHLQAAWWVFFASFWGEGGGRFVIS